MPTMTDDEIKSAIADGTISVISIDTSVFDRYQCHLDSPILNKLDQFKAGAVRVLLSEIIANEVKSHILRDAEKFRLALDNAVKNQCDRWKIKPNLVAISDALALTSDPRAAAEEQFSAYVQAVGAMLIPACDSTGIAAEVLRRYFATEPPFEDGGKKKHEFPDAFALLSLEATAKAWKKSFLCVSEDNGWINFSAQSDHLVCVNKLDIALSYFNESGRNVADRAMDIWQRGLARELESEIDAAFEYRLEDLDFDAVADAPAEFESYPLSAALQFVDVGTATPPIVIAADDESVTFTTTVEALVAFEAEFDFYVTDSIDKDHISLSQESFSVEKRNSFQLVINILRDLEPEPQVVEVEVTKKALSVDFGHVEPFPRDDPTHEKY